MMAQMPDNVGLSNTFAGFGLGMSGFAFAISIDLIVNPEHKTADVIVLEGADYVNYFGDDVSVMMPYWWLYVGIFCVVIGFVSYFLITDKTNTENKLSDHIANIVSAESLKNLSEEEKNKIQNENLENFNGGYFSNRESFRSESPSRKGSNNSYLAIISAKSNIIQNEKTSMNSPSKSDKLQTGMNEPLNEMKELQEIDSRARVMSNQTGNESGGLLYADDDDFDEKMLNSEAEREFKQKKIWVLLFMSVVILSFPIYFMNYFAIFCNQYYDATIATRFSPMSCIMSVCFRALFGLILDNYGVVIFLYIQLGTNILAVLGLWFQYENQFVFLLCYSALYGLYGSACVFYYVICNYEYGEKLGPIMFSRVGYASGLGVITIALFDGITYFAGWRVSYGIILAILAYCLTQCHQATSKIR